MPKTLREYMIAALLVVAAALLIGGVFVLHAAVAVEGYLAALLLWALAGVSFFGARELQPRGIPLSDPTTDLRLEDGNGTEAQ